MLDIWVVKREGGAPGIEFVSDPALLSEEDVNRLVYCAGDMQEALRFMQGVLSGDVDCAAIWDAHQ